MSNDTDADDGLDSGTVVVNTAPANGTAVANPDGTITYTHSGSESTGDSFSYTVKDAAGNTSNVATVNVTVSPVNDNPLANNDSLLLNEGAFDTVDVLANDTDVDDGLNPGSVTISSAPANGTAVVNLSLIHI